MFLGRFWRTKHQFSYTVSQNIRLGICSLGNDTDTSISLSIINESHDSSGMDRRKMTILSKFDGGVCRSTCEFFVTVW